MELEKYNPDTEIDATNFSHLVDDSCAIIEQAQAVAYKAVNEILIKRNWLLGMRIRLEMLKDKRAEYGEKVVKNLAQELTNRYGKGFSMRNLYNFITFYHQHQNIFPGGEWKI